MTEADRGFEKRGQESDRYLKIAARRGSIDLARHLARQERVLLARLGPKHLADGSVKRFHPPLNRRIHDEQPHAVIQEKWRCRPKTDQ